MMELDLQSRLHLSHSAVDDGTDMPRFGLGTARMKDPEVVAHAVSTALLNGYRMVDTSKNYENEEAVGQGIRRSALPESGIYVVTKLEEEDFGTLNVPSGFLGSLSRLNVQKIDLYLIHSPEHDKALRQETWRAMLDLLGSGRCRAVGVSNYGIEHIREIIEINQLLPAVNQIELNPFNYAKQRPVVEFCQQHDIHLMAYSPLGVGEVLSDPRLRTIAQNYGKTPAQVLLRWGLQHDFIVIPKSDQADHIVENAQVFDFTLSEDEMREMDGWGA